MSDIVNTLSVTVVFLEVLKRNPTSDELDLYVPQFAASTMSSSDLQTILQDTMEYKILQGTYSGDVVYNDASWSLSISNIVPSNYKGLTLANGKIALITSPVHNEMQHSFISTNFDNTTFGRYVNNVTETFEYTRLHMFSRDPSKVSVTNATQTLTMLNGNFENTYTVTSGSDVVNVVHDITPLRSYPYCVLQTITLSSPTALTLDVYHDLITPDSAIQDVVYANNTIITTLYNHSQRSIPFFNANGKLKDTNKKISTSCAYVFDGSSSSIRPQGYNMVRTDPNQAYNLYNIDLEGDDSYGYTATFHIVSATMTEYDFPFPDIETQRILVNLVPRSTIVIFADNTTSWASAWQSNIVIDPKDNLQTQEEIDAVANFQRQVRFALFNIYSLMREDINVEVNPLNLSTIDLTGQIFYSGELWVLPVLMFLKPKAVKTLLDFRYKQLTTAMKLAAAQGYVGSKYPHETDIAGYNDIYWDTISPLAVFNTALISISVWNYFRVTGDQDWLIKKGYEILKNNANFFADIMQYSSSDGLYHLSNIICMNNINSSDNAMTNYMINLAIKYALEATYQINYVANPNWVAIYGNIALPILTTVIENNVTYRNIIGLDNNYAVGYEGDPVRIPEPLIILHPFYNQELFLNNTYTTDILSQNLNYYMSKIPSADQANGVNLSIEGALFGTIAQNQIEYNSRVTVSNQFLEEMTSIGTSSTMNPWGTYFNSMYNTKSFNDLTTSSAFILSLLTSIGGFQLAGGINSTRFTYETFGIRFKTTAVMPSTWKRITFSGIGNAEGTYIVVNPMLYPNP